MHKQSPELAAMNSMRGDFQRLLLEHRKLKAQFAAQRKQEEDAAKAAAEPAEEAPQSEEDAGVDDDGLPNYEG